jgi:Spy/CpxP family protein refolding chaperone
MKKIIIAAVAFVSFSTLKAQPPMGGTPPTKEQMEQRRIKNEANLVASFKELELTDDQILKVREILKEAQAKGGEVRRDESLDREAKRAKNKEIDDARDAKLKELLGEAPSKE